MVLLLTGLLLRDELHRLVSGRAAVGKQKPALDSSGRTLRGNVKVEVLQFVAARDRQYGSLRFLKNAGIVRKRKRFVARDYVVVVSYEKVLALTDVFHLEATVLIRTVGGRLRFGGMVQRMKPETDVGHRQSLSAEHCSLDRRVLGEIEVGDSTTFFL